MAVRESHTISSGVKINHVSDADVNYTKEALVLLFEFLLVKNLDCKDAVFSGFPVRLSVHISRSDECSAHVKDLIPVWIEGLLDNGGSSGLLTTDRRYCKGVWKPCPTLSGLALFSDEA